MKRILLFLTVFLLLAIPSLLTSVRGQTIASTGQGLAPCWIGNCAPNGWTGSFAISNRTHAGGEHEWVILTYDVLDSYDPITLPAPPSGNVGPLGQSTQPTFLSFTGSFGEQGVVSTQMSGLVPGKKYALKYFLMSSQTEDAFECEKATVSTNGALNTHDFNTKFSIDVWTPGVLHFTAVATTQTLTITNLGAGVAYEYDFRRFLSVDIKGSEWLVNESCTAGTSQLTLTKANLVNSCGSSTVNLNESGPSGLPAGSNAIVWYDNPQHNGLPVSNPSQVDAGTYYAFITDWSSDCYNTSNSTAKVTVTIVPLPNNGQQVPLTKSTLSNICPSPTVNLNSTFSGSIPAGTSLFWYNGPQHTGQAIGNPTQVSTSGTYYAFFYNPTTQCFNTDNSTAKVDVSISPVGNTSQVVLDKISISNVCPLATANLHSAYSGPAPCGSSVIWYNNPFHSGSPVLSPSSVGAGNYYAFFVNVTEGTYNTDYSVAKVTVSILGCPPCNAGTAQVVLKGNKVKNICPAGTVNLNHMFDGVVPEGATLVFYSTPDHAPGTLEAGPHAVADSETYYAFFYDSVNECFNTDNSTAQLVVTITTCPPPCDAGTSQVQVLSSLANTCPSNTVNLNNAITGISKPVTWFSNPTHSGSPVAFPHAAIQGTYYAFYYDNVNDCWNTNNSTAKVTVTINVCCPVPTNQVVLSKNTLSNVCPRTNVSLNNAFTGSAPAGTTLVWFNNAGHTGAPIADPLHVIAGTYYAFFYNAAYDCYNTGHSTSAVVVTITNCAPCFAGTAQVVLKGNKLQNVCPATVVNLLNMIEGSAPPNSAPVFYTTPDHTPGTAIANSQSVTQSGTYYAFFYDPVGDCFNTDNSTAQVAVTINICNNQTQLNLKVSLEGAMPVAGTIMRSDLQNYFGEFLGLLPTMDPYGSGKVYANINNPTAVAGAVVDWVRVEIRGAANPSNVMEIKSLLLKSDGSIVDVTGALPTFAPQVGNVQIAVKHRNHVAVLSNPMPFTPGVQVNYDFTTALSQAFNPFNDPMQMVLKNGKWCMLTGDVNAVQDFSIDGVDGTIFNPKFNQGVFDIYEKADLNLDGVVDGVDGTYFNNSFKKGFYSTLINF